MDFISEIDHIENFEHGLYVTRESSMDHVLNIVKLIILLLK